MASTAKLVNLVYLKSLALYTPHNAYKYYSGYESLRNLPNLQSISVNGSNTEVLDELRKVLPEEKIMISE